MIGTVFPLSPNVHQHTAQTVIDATIFCYAQAMIQVRFKYDNGLERCNNLQMSCDVYKKIPDPVTNADILACYIDIDITDINSALIGFCLKLL